MSGLPRPSEPWPLSGVATALLRGPDTPPHHLFRLGLKELVVRGVLTLEREEHRRILGGHRVRLRVGPGHAKVPPAAPLPELDVAVRRVLRGDRKELEDTVNGLFEDDRRLPERLRGAAARDLEARGLLRAQRTRVLGLVPRTRRERTA